jgi:murein DD-endopeptidase MepM/ murein hydrolase activator NlpD
MGNPFKYFVCALSVLVLASACTQQPARITDRSSQYYGHGPSSNGALYRDSNTPYTHVERDSEPPHQAAPAPAPSVSVSDLPPPQASSFGSSKSVAAIQPQEQQPSQPALSSHQGTNKFIWPVTGGKVISRFGSKPDGKSNDGINIAISEGEPIYAVADGMVVYAGNQLPSYGNMVIIRHDNGIMTAYAHARSLSVKKNDFAKQGEIIGYVGMSGSVKSPQLHFAVRNGKTPIDPERYLPGG